MVSRRLGIFSKTGGRQGRTRMHSNSHFLPPCRVRRVPGDTTHDIPGRHPRHTLPRCDNMRHTCRLAPDRLPSEIAFVSSLGPILADRTQPAPGVETPEQCGRPMSGQMARLYTPVINDSRPWRDWSFPLAVLFVPSPGFTSRSHRSSPVSCSISNRSPGAGLAHQPPPGVFFRSFLS